MGGISFLLVLILYIKNYVVCQRNYRIQSFSSIQHVYGHLCKHLEIDSSTNLEGRIRTLDLYSNMHKYQQSDVYFYQCYNRADACSLGLDTNYWIF